MEDLWRLKTRCFVAPLLLVQLKSELSAVCHFARLAHAPSNVFVFICVSPRLCVLVQDSYGMFSVVQLHILPCQDDLGRYCHMWQGRTCSLRDVKVVQRVTRER